MPTQTLIEKAETFYEEAHESSYRLSQPRRSHKNKNYPVASVKKRGVFERLLCAPHTEIEEPPLTYQEAYHKVIPSTPRTHASTKSPPSGYSMKSSFDSLSPDSFTESTFTQSNSTETGKDDADDDDVLRDIQSQLRYLEREIVKTRQTGRSVDKQNMMDRLSSLMKSLEEHNNNSNNAEDDDRESNALDTDEESDTIEIGKSVRRLQRRRQGQADREEEEEVGFIDEYANMFRKDIRETFGTDVLAEDLLNAFDAQIANPIEDFFSSLIDGVVDEGESQSEGESEGVIEDRNEGWWQPQPWEKDDAKEPSWLRSHDSPSKKSVKTDDSSSSCTPNPVPATIDVAVESEWASSPLKGSNATTSDIKSFWKRKKAVMAVHKSARSTPPRVTGGLSATSTYAYPDGSPPRAKAGLNKSQNNYSRPSWDDVSGTTDASGLSMSNQNPSKRGVVGEKGRGVDPFQHHHVGTENTHYKTPPRRGVKSWVKKGVSCFSKPPEYETFDFGADTAERNYEGQKIMGSPNSHAGCYPIQEEGRTVKNTQDTLYLSRSQPHTHQYRGLYYGKSSAASILRGEDPIDASDQNYGVRRGGSPSRLFTKAQNRRGYV
mmetsp:Transcript_18467/g.26055  ORF Transcript_18467/g.26055 Transcript_18467/m.26055 type:complete len:604 (+) Transcript_18467:199-2010(+)